MSIDTFIKKYLIQIEQTFENNQFEQIYLGCDQEIFLEKCQMKFKDKLIYPIHNRARGQEDWFTKTTSLLDEFVYALTDAMNLSKCHYFLGSPSNLTFAVLTFNPDLDFQIFNHLKTVHTG
jgi:hypothetical protein